MNNCFTKVSASCDNMEPCVRVNIHHRPRRKHLPLQHADNSLAEADHSKLVDSVFWEKYRLVMISRSDEAHSNLALESDRGELVSSLHGTWITVLAELAQDGPTQGKTGHRFLLTLLHVQYIFCELNQYGRSMG